MTQAQPRQSIGSESLAKIMAATEKREPAKPTGHMRERIAAAILGSRPSYYMWEPKDAYPRFLWHKQDTREMYEQWADDFLRCLDVLNLEITDVNELRANGEEPRR